MADQERYEDEGGRGGFMMGLLTGTVLGAGLGMLLAPKAGSELRGVIGDQARTIGSKASEQYRRASDQAAGLADRSRDMMGRATEQASTLADRGRELVDRARESVSRGAEEAKNDGNTPDGPAHNGSQGAGDFGRS